MRYVLYAAIALFAASIWLNTSHQGARLQRQMNAHPADPSQLWGH